MHTAPHLIGSCVGVGCRVGVAFGIPNNKQRRIDKGVVWLHPVNVNANSNGRCRKWKQIKQILALFGSVRKGIV